MFSPLSRKTFRFVLFEIQTFEEELIIEDFYNNYAGYPFEEKATFNSEDKQFFDPYYEQLQYIGDTRIEALVSIYVSGDDRLMRKAIKQFNLDSDAEKYDALAQRIQASVLKTCYHEKDQATVMQEVLRDSSLIQATIYFKFYLFRALQKCGMGDLYLTQLDPWKKMLNNGMTTFGERDGIMRSECHGWSASPCFDLLHTVAGIYPLNPGFRTIAVKPNFGDLETMKVSFPHPDGMLSLDLSRQGEKVSGSIILPQNTKGEFTWNGRSILLSEGENRIY